MKKIGSGTIYTSVGRIKRTNRDAEDLKEAINNHDLVEQGEDMVSWSPVWANLWELDSLLEIELSRDTASAKILLLK